MKDNELHKLLNEKLDNFEMPVAPNSWDALEQRLPSQPTRRIVPLWVKWSVAAACVLALVMFSFMWSINSNNNGVVDSSELIAEEHTTKQSPVSVTLNDCTQELEQQTSDPQSLVASTQGITKVNTQKSVPVVVKAVPAENLTIAKPASTLPTANSELLSAVESLPTPVAQSPLLAEADNHPATTSTTPSVISEEEAEQLLAQTDNDLEQHLKQQNVKSSRRTATNPNSTSLGLLASLNANDKVGSHLINRPNKVGLLGGKDEPSDDLPSLTPPETLEEMRNDLPFSVGLSVAVPLAKRWDFITGIDYTYMHSQRNTTIMGSASKVSSDYDMHYMGIPAQISFRIIDRNLINLYVSLGGKMEKGLSRIETKSLLDENGQWIGQSDKFREQIKGLQWSVGGNFGVSLRLIGRLSFYVEPGLSYYIPNFKNPQPNSMRTDNPFFFSLSGGLRFTTK